VFQVASVWALNDAGIKTSVAARSGEVSFMGVPVGGG
jgi:hypothetical protein